MDSAQAWFAVGWLLYEAQNAWVAQRRPVEDFPLGFAHACAEGYGTAQGRYLGKEAAAGGGNHLADCLLTRDPDRYGATRPAQLWRSDAVAGRAVAGPGLPAVRRGRPRPRPADRGGRRRLADERAERLPVLARLLTVLEDPAGRRVTIVSTAPTRR